MAIHRVIQEEQRMWKLADITDNVVDRRFINIGDDKTSSNLFDSYSGFFFSMALQPVVGPWLLFSFLIVYTVGRTPWMGDQPLQGHYLYTQYSANTE
jgi:hypothetical protein